jgi:hypothetical protein
MAKRGGDGGWDEENIFISAMIAALRSELNRVNRSPRSTQTRVVIMLMHALCRGVPHLIYRFFLIIKLIRKKFE